MEYIKCDVTEPSSIAEAAANLRSKWGHPTILINNAGIGKPHSLVDTPNEFVTKIFAINVISHFCKYGTEDVLKYYDSRSESEIRCRCSNMT